MPSQGSSLQAQPLSTLRVQNIALSLTETDQVNPGESYDPLLINVDEGEETS
jgi:hypothetical protein